VATEDPRSERDLQNRIKAAVAREGVRPVWSNDTGVAIAPSVLDYRIQAEDVGKTVKQAVPAKQARRISFGLPGSPDIIGILPPHGRFVGIEVKVPGNTQSDQQRNFGAVATEQGALYIVAHSVDEAVAAIRSAEPLSGIRG
jgi:hypothetical protein